MTACWILVAEVVDPEALAGFYRGFGDEEAAVQTLSEGCGSWVVDSFDWQDDAQAAEGNQPSMPGLDYHVEERVVAR